MNRISDEKIKAIAAEYLVNGMVKTKALITVGYSKNYAEHGGLKLFDNDRLKDEIAHQQAIIAEKTNITVGNLQNRLMLLAEKAEAQKKLGVAKSCIDSLLKTIGGFQTDQINPANKQQRELPGPLKRRIEADIKDYYSTKYLAEGDVTVIDVKPDNNS